MRRRAQLEDRGDDVDGPDEPGHLGERDELRPEVGALAWTELRARQRHVVEPPGLRPGVEHEHDDQHEAAEQQQPVRIGIEPREGDVARADHERDQIERDRFHHGHGEQEHHHAAVHGEQLVVSVGSDDVAVGPCELQAHHRGEQSGEHEERERREDEADADALVVDGREPADEPRFVGPSCFEAGHLRLAR
jgi:hypothetical protein